MHYIIRRYLHYLKNKVKFDQNIKIVMGNQLNSDTSTAATAAK